MENVKEIIDTFFAKNEIFFDSTFDKRGQSFDYFKLYRNKVDYFSINYVKYYHEIVFGSSIAFFFIFLKLIIYYQI
jgi:hypothetical protein